MTPHPEDKDTPSIDIAFTPVDIQPTQVAVIVDVLRATSTIITALEAGYQRVLCTTTIEEAEELRGPGRLLAGERNCRPIEGFDFGNSPRAFDTALSEELVLCTSNGTPAILSALSNADEVLVGSLLNLNALTERIPPGQDVMIVCAGTHGRFALEDAYAAGRMVERLEGERTDAARAAVAIATAYGETYEPLAQSDDAAVLRETDQEADIEFCAQESISSLVPEITPVTSQVAAASFRLHERAAGDGVPEAVARPGVEED